MLTNIHGTKQCTLKLCVAVRKRLYLYYWKNSAQIFYEIKPDTELLLPDIPKVMSWCKNSVCVGFKRDYFMYEVSKGWINKYSVVRSGIEGTFEILRGLVRY